MKDRNQIMIERAREVGLSLEVRDTAGWYQYSFLRYGDGMCVAVLYETDEAESWLDGYTAAVTYPPVKHEVSLHVFPVRDAEAGLP